jgi:hypothetical protein
MKRHVSWQVWAVVACLAPSFALAADRKPNIRITKPSVDRSAEVVDLFPAIEAGKIDAKLIMISSKQATVLIENKTKQPLNVRLPDAFVGVLAQAGGVNDPFGGGGQGGGQQAGGMGGGGFGGGQGGFGNVPAERVGEIRLAAVCLEHGKDEPRPSIKYDLKPVEAFSKDPALHAMLKLFGEKKINQRVAQAAAWHLASKMSWEELSAKQIKRIGQGPQPYFSPQELRAAWQLVEAAKTAAEKRPADSSKSGSLSAR